MSAGLASAPAARGAALPLAAALLAASVAAGCIEASAGEPRSTCGNGRVEEGEPCDPGVAGARCSDDCVPLTCGDGVVSEAIGEECDPAFGDETPARCDVQLCQRIECGNARIDAGEGCDLGVARNGARGEPCLSTCQPVTCGDGLVEGAEACDDGERNDDRFGACREDCTLARCGDGELGPGEQCDGAPGCTETCELQGCAAVQVAAGYWSSYVLTADGRVYGFGAMADGALPLPPRTPADGCVTATREATRCVGRPTQLSLPPLARIAGGANGGVGLLADGTGVVTWGLDDRGQRGDGAVGGTSPPTVLDHATLAAGGALGALRGVAIGRDHFLAWDDAGRIVGAGSDATGALLVPDEEESACGEGLSFTATPDSAVECFPAPVQVFPPEGTSARPIETVVAGRGHVVVLGQDRILNGWGNPSHGQLAALATSLASCAGFQAFGSYPSPQLFRQRSWQIAVAGFSTYWLDDERRLQGVGSGCYGELGRPAQEPTFTPQPVVLAEGGRAAAKLRFIGASSSYVFGIAIDDEDALWSFGRSVRGAAGFDPAELPELADRPHRFTIDAAARPVEVAMGRAQALIRLEDGSVYTLGANDYGQLGQGGSGDDLVHATPVRVHLPCEDE